MCPYCKQSEKILKKGTYLIASVCKKVQRYICVPCGKGFSDQTLSFDYRWRKRKINQSIFRMISKGCSQRGCAQVLGVTPQTVARRVISFGAVSRAKLEKKQKSGIPYGDILIDEMESFEHTKLKPLTIPIGVEKQTRKIIALEVGTIAAKGLLAAKSKAKYGYRKCQRSQVLAKVFVAIKSSLGQGRCLISDESPHYPKFAKSILKGVPHIRHKGGRGAIIGQGELKKQGFDPLFQLNHSYAMIRDNIKRLTRRTWCTTKKISRLLDMLHIYANYHNQILDGIKRPVVENIPN